jgi:hypothetical protein
VQNRVTDHGECNGSDGEAWTRRLGCQLRSFICQGGISARTSLAAASRVSAFDSVLKNGSRNCTGGPDRLRFGGGKWDVVALDHSWPTLRVTWTDLVLLHVALQGTSSGLATGHPALYGGAVPGGP